jgi:RNA-directed DNA polymerase
MRTTESQINTDTALLKIAYLSSHDPSAVYHSLMHHINKDSLRSCFEKLDGKKAVGVDKVNKDMYGGNLRANLEDLIKRMKHMSYRPGPVRQVLIPKEGKPGATRPLGISNFEDKLVQKRIQEILEAIYDPVFLDKSYGFRPGMGCHDAIKDLSTYLYKEEVETILDIDLANFFGTIDHSILLDFIKIKIKDTKFLRYLSRMFKAGVLAEGELIVSDEGVPQGSCCSPVMANVVAHYVIDLWIEEIVKPLTKGKIEMFRYADDLVICCKYETDAIRIKSALSKRLAKYKLKLNDDKTKLVSFSVKKRRQGIKQETFDFLGFTFYLGISTKGYIIQKLKTNGKRFRSKLKAVNDWARKNRNRMPLKQLWKIFCSKLRGHLQYYCVSFNLDTTSNFVLAAKRIMFKWLNRRSQRKSFNWSKFSQFISRFPLPKVRVHHRLF